MVRQPNESLDAQKSVPLKLSEQVVDSNNPWADDLLARQDIATRLTNLVATQEPPLTISLHGQWGTGKTFMLKRWQKDLEGQGFKAIYFNAWEDDFCDDPLLAILGQMTETFNEGSLKSLTEKIVATAVTLFKKNALSILSNKTGITLETEQDERDLLKEYLNQRATKDELKENLAKLSASIFNETKHPLVFIIDELDRCRPSFAIELLERVKHIFDVPHMVFVFGLNRDELSKSLSSVYGDINTDVYLRRFFDFEFNLTEADSRGFAEQLIDRFQLVQVFQRLDEALAGSGQRNYISSFRHTYDYDNYRAVIPGLWAAFGLSLRDIDYGIRLLALLARNVPVGAFTHPYLLAVLIAMKFKKPDVYRELVRGNFRTSEIMAYIDDAVRQDLVDRDSSSNLDHIEGFLYCADNANHELQEPGTIALNELSRVGLDNTGFTFRVISQRAQNADEGQLARIADAIRAGRSLRVTSYVFGRLAMLIDTYQGQLRR